MSIRTDHDNFVSELGLSNVLSSFIICFLLSSISIWLSFSWLLLVSRLFSIIILLSFNLSWLFLLFLKLLVLILLLHLLLIHFHLLLLHHLLFVLQIWVTSHITSTVTILSTLTQILLVSYFWHLGNLPLIFLVMCPVSIKSFFL